MSIVAAGRAFEAPDALAKLGTGTDNGCAHVLGNGLGECNEYRS
jgi:hypothetical protein